RIPLSKGVQSSHIIYMQIRMKYFTSVILLLIAASIGVTVDAIAINASTNANVGISYDQAIRHDYLRKLVFNRSDGLLLFSYHAITHPAQPNYIATICGDTRDITYGVRNIGGPSIVDLLEKNKSLGKLIWKTIDINLVSDFLFILPYHFIAGDCYTEDEYIPPGKTSSIYDRKYNPFISMSDINTDPVLCPKIVPGSQLDTDIMGINGRTTGLNYAMTWFEDWFENKLNKTAFTKNTLFLITFDEDDRSGDNHVFAGLYGSPVKPPTSHEDIPTYNHYSFMATVEENWSLGDLGRNDTTTSPFTDYLHDKQILNVENKPDVNVGNNSVKVENKPDVNVGNNSLNVTENEDATYG
ncbi:13289_t:CDS:2, partial [Racocetra persica]